MNTSTAAALTGGAIAALIIGAVLFYVLTVIAE